MEKFSQTLKAFMRRLVHAVGFDKKSAYVRKHMNEENVRSGFYMGIVVVALEIWMLFRQILEKLPERYKPEHTWLWNFFRNTSYFWLLLFVGMAMAVFCFTYHRKMNPKLRLGLKVGFAAPAFIWTWLIFFERFNDMAIYNVLIIMLYAVSGAFAAAIIGGAIYEYYKGKDANWLSITTITLFSIIMLAFGVWVSYLDFIGGKEIICFLTMMIYAACLLVWRPYISVAMVGAIFEGFYLLIIHYVPETSLGDFQSGDAVNYITFFISLSMVAISLYHQRFNGADKSEKLERLAQYDDLTGAHNYRHFLGACREYLAEHQSDHEAKVFLFIDIVNFKIINNQRGFEEGNEFLKQTAVLLEEAFGEEFTCRVGDDHFAAMAEKATFMEKLQDLNAKVVGLNPDVGLSIVAGGMVLPRKDYDPRRAMEHARYACSLVKGNGELIYNEYDSKMSDALNMHHYITRHIDEAVEKGWIKPFYQPVVWSKDGTLSGCEALARWIDPELGFLSPGAFVPVLEEARLIHKLDRAILRAVCRDLRERLDANLPVVPVSINFSRLDFELMDAVEELKACVAEYNIPKELLHVEITESALVNDLGLLTNAVKKLKAEGFALWLDDFGSGYSSLNVLKDYSFDVLKIDMKFLVDFENNEKSKSLIESIINMAEHIGMLTLCEGVESKVEADFLSKIGCGRLQGYLYGKPLPKEELTHKFFNE
ncbi:MAG: bifunctional diguanylate cyclase/phosphodiesterase [Bacilli bacterium]|nr:bifunctional diguanylate cyclase/phosphodiesterase [Bacilli bacterium]